MLFLLLHAEFLAAAQVVVYAGAVMVLYVFVVAYIGGSDEPLRPEGGGLATFGPLFAAAIAIELCIAFLGTGLEAVDTRGADVGAGFGSPGEIGSLLLRKFLVPFEAASYLLLVAAVGAVVLARRRRGLEDAAPTHEVDAVEVARWTSPGSSSSRRSSSASARRACSPAATRS